MYFWLLELRSNKWTNFQRRQPVQCCCVVIMKSSSFLDYLNVISRDWIQYLLSLYLITYIKSPHNVSQNHLVWRISVPSKFQKSYLVNGYSSWSASFFEPISYVFCNHAWASWKLARCWLPYDPNHNFSKKSRRIWCGMFDIRPTICFVLQNESDLIASLSKELNKNIELST